MGGGGVGVWGRGGGAIIEMMAGHGWRSVKNAEKHREAWKSVDSGSCWF